MAKGAGLKPILEILMGLAVLPVVGAFIATAIADPNISNIPGAVIVIPLIGIAIAFGLIYKGIKDAVG